MRRLAIIIGIIGVLLALGAPTSSAQEQPTIGMPSAEHEPSPATSTSGPSDRWILERRIALPITIEGPGLVVRAQKGLDDVARRVAASAKQELEDIAIDLAGLPIPEVVEIRLVEDTTNLDDAAPYGGVPAWAVGVAFSSHGVVIAARRRGNEILDIDNTVAHELAHLALGAALDGRAPRWLNEGFAYLHSSEWSFARFRTLVGMAWSGDVIELYDLDRSFPAEEFEAHRAYAQSYDFVAFLARRGRYVDTEDDGNPLPFRRFLRAIGKGQSLEAAAEHAFGATLGDLFGEWKRGLRTRYLLVPAEMFGLLVWIFAAALLVIGYIRRKRRNRVTLARWDEEEAERQTVEPPPPPPHTPPAA